MSEPPAAEAAPDAEPLPDEALLAEIEAEAVALARAAGAEIVATLGREISVQYKTEAKGDAAPTDPVSEVDHAVEQLIRERLAERFPDHAVVGEEVDGHPAPEAEFVWAVDPVDGTTNFVNGFPLFASSIGVLHRGRPVVGAIWVSTGHELRPGVYHAHRGGTLQFDGRAAPAGRPSSGVSRRLGAAPGGAARTSGHWDHRVTGSAAIECAFVAAGIFNSATFWGPGLWDVAAGATLVLAAGGEVWMRGPGGWAPIDRFEPPAKLPRSQEGEQRAPSLRDWRRPLLIGEREVLAHLRATVRGPSLWRRLRRRLRRG